MTQNGSIRFYSETPVENIEAINKQVSSVIDLESETIAFSLLMKAFVFEKALMQEHFNEKYVHSDKFPKASFKGSIAGIRKLKVGAGVQNLEVIGILTIHGVSKEVKTTAQVSRVDGKIKASAVFTIQLADYDISVPAAVINNISETIEITVDMDYEAL